MKQTFPDTTCAIMTRHTRMNTAGGVELTVRTILPFFDRVEIYDTGSADGSREDIEQLATDFTNLHVASMPWQGFVKSRNKILEKIQTRRIFMIDDDEMLDPRVISRLIQQVKANPTTGAFWFSFLQQNP